MATTKPSYKERLEEEAQRKQAAEAKAWADVDKLLEKEIAKQSGEPAAAQVAEGAPVSVGRSATLDSIAYILAVLSSFVPTYVAAEMLGLKLTAPQNLPFFIFTTALGVVVLVFCYGILNKNYYSSLAKALQGAAIADEHAETLEKVRHNYAQSHAIFFANTVFIGLSSVLMLYLFKNQDARMNLTFSVPISAGALYLLARYDEDAVKRQKTGKSKSKKN